MSPLQIEQLRTKAQQGQPEAQFLLSKNCHQNRDYDGMIHWLKQASASDLPDALNALDRGLLEVLVSPNGGWTILLTYPKRPTCVIATGAGWEGSLLQIGQPA